MATPDSIRNDVLQGWGRAWYERRLQRRRSEDFNAWVAAHPEDVQAVIAAHPEEMKALIAASPEEVNALVAASREDVNALVAASREEVNALVAASPEFATRFLGLDFETRRAWVEANCPGWDLKAGGQKLE